MTYAGPSILEQLWEELDGEIYNLMQMVQDGWGEHDSERARQAGVCLGLSMAIWRMSTPVYATVDEVKAAGMARYEQRHVSGE